MPDTMIQTETLPATIPASCRVMEGYCSPALGKLVAARAKAAKQIKSIVKDKQADIPGKPGGRGYKYSYADLADVFDAVEDAISEQALAIFQTTQDRGRDGTYLMTVLAHESDQLMVSEIRLKSADLGPQLHGSEMTYLRRYQALAILGLAPEQDDDGRAAQDRADQGRQQSRQTPVQPQQSRRPEPPRQAPAPTQQAPAPVSDSPVHTPIPADHGGLRVREWLDLAKTAMDGRSEAWRGEWLRLHKAEMEDLRELRPDWADRVEAAALAPDVPAQAAA